MLCLLCVSGCKLLRSETTGVLRNLNVAEKEQRPVETVEDVLFFLLLPESLATGRSSQMMTRARKVEEVAHISSCLEKAKAAFLVDFKGMNVEEVTTLRKSLHPVQSEMKVVRNTLARRALKEHPHLETCLAEHFVGTNAIVFAYDDASTSAKKLTEFGKEVEALVIKTGIMGGRSLDEAQIKHLATLPSKEELQAKLLGTLQAPMSKFVRVLNEVPSGLARLLGAYRDSKKESLL